MSNLDCNVIKDLMELYVDDLSSTESNRIIEEHIKECDNCALYLKELNNGELIKDSVIDKYEVDENIEVELIRKLRWNRSKGLFICSLIGALLASLLTTGSLLFHALLLMPLFGCVIYLIFKDKLMAPLFIFVIQLINQSIQMFKDLSIQSSMSGVKFWDYISYTIGNVQFALIFALLTFIGVIIGILLKKVFIDK